MFPRHLPPTATPLALHQWMSGLHPAQDAGERFRGALAAYFDVPYVGLASSGRTALFLIFATLAARREFQGRTEVLLPAYTCPSVAKVVLDAGLTPRLVDIDPQTHSFRAGALAANTGPNTLAIVCVHAYGLALSVDEAIAAAQGVGAVVIEDAAQAMGAAWADRPVGTRGDFGLFSLGPGKPLSVGGGGVVCTHNPDYADGLERAGQRLSRLNEVKAGWALVRLGLFTLAFHPSSWWLAVRMGVTKMGDSEASWGYTLTGLAATQASVGLRLLPALDAINAARRARALTWIEHLRGIDGLCLPRAHDPEAHNIFLRLPLVLPDASYADELARRLAAAGIGAGRMYQRTLDEIFPQLRGPVYPGATQVARGLLTLPTNHYVHDVDIPAGAALIRAFLAQA